MPTWKADTSKAKPNSNNSKSLINQNMEKTLKLTADQAKKMLGKDNIMDALIKANFTNKELGFKITDQIKTFEDAIAYNGVSIEDFTKSTAFDMPHHVAQKKIEQIALALNEGTPMKYDGSTSLYYPYFLVGSGVGFSCSDFICDSSCSYVGSRLCYRTKELSIYAGKQFTNIYEEYLNG